MNMDRQDSQILMRLRKILKKEKISNIKESGVPIWFSKDYKYVWF